MNHYELLNIQTDCDYATLKRAYYAKAKQCHPDLFSNSPEKTEAFRRLVEAFNILSDPERRAKYDESLRLRARVRSSNLSPESILDTDADDTLEELIVGNSPPEDATLMTLFRDLERTVVFITWREARTYYAERRFRIASRLFLKLVVLAPDNILYRVYLARSFFALKEYSKARYHYKAALNIGERRSPPQNLMTVREELDRLRKKENPLLHRIRKALFPGNAAPYVPSDEQMIREASRAMQNILDSQERKRLGR